MTKNEVIEVGREVIVMLRLKFKPGAIAQVLNEIVSAAMLTRKEGGNIEFQVYRAKDDVDRLVLFERWADQAALDHHWQQDYTKRVLVLFEENLVRPLSQVEDVTHLSDVLQAVP